MSLISEMEIENELIDQAEQLILSYKKQIHEVKKEKERLIIQVKTNYKQIDNLSKRKDTLNNNSTKMYLDFKDTLHLNDYEWIEL